LSWIIPTLRLIGSIFLRLRLLYRLIYRITTTTIGITSIGAIIDTLIYITARIATAAITVAAVRTIIYPTIIFISKD
jgi:hypothetical protein